MKVDYGKSGLMFPLVQRIERLAEHIGAGEQVDLQTTHVTGGGMYARSFIIPAGVAVVGATHKKDHLDVMQGDVSFTTGDGLKRLTGMHVLSTKAGAKRVGFAHSETKWTTIVRTELTDIHAIEEECVVEAEQLQTRRLEIERRQIFSLKE